MSEITQHIINLVKKKNRAAQKQLYYFSKDRLKKVAIRYCLSLQEAKDVVQESYLKIYRSIDTFDSSKGSFEAWSTKIVINESYAILRKKLKKEEFVSKPLYKKPVSTINIDKLTLEEVQVAMTKLKTDYQLVLNMYFFEEYSYREISEILKIKESSVRSKVTRAKAELINYWTDHNKVNYEYK